MRSRKTVSQTKEKELVRASGPKELVNFAAGKRGMMKTAELCIVLNRKKTQQELGCGGEAPRQLQPGVLTSMFFRRGSRVKMASAEERTDLGAKQRKCGYKEFKSFESAWRFWTSEFLKVQSEGLLFSES